MVTSHFIVYKTFAKSLAEQPGSTYTFISGGSGEECEKGKLWLADASLINPSSSADYGLYHSAFAEFYEHKKLKINQLRIFCWIRPVPDSTFDSSKPSLELGNDVPGGMVVKMAEKHRSGIYKVLNREESEKETIRIEREMSAKAVKHDLK
jgi:hypothetical protein